MFKVMQIFSKESEDPKTNRWNNSSKKYAGAAHNTYISSLIGKLKSKKIIVVLCLAIATFMIIPVIPILLAFLAGRWLRLADDKSLKKEYV